MTRWTATTILPTDDTDPAALLDQLEAQPNSFVFTDVVERRKSPTRVTFKLRGNTPGLAGRAVEHCEHVLDDIEAVTIALVNNTTDTVQLEYLEPDGDRLRVVDQQPGRLEWRSSNEDATYATMYPVITPDNDDLREEYTDLKAWCAEEYGLRPLVTYG